MHGAAAHWLANALDPHFSDASHGYRPRLGVQTAAAAVTAHLAAHSGAWVLDADIQRCFDDIPHHCVISALSQHGLWNGKLAWVIKNCLHAEVHPACVTGGPYCIARGMPQGSPLSPVLANVVLDEFDRSLQRVGLAHVRYADDFVVVCQDQSAAQYARQHCAQSLQALGLRLSDEKTRILSADQGFDFLGRRFAIATATFSASTTTHPTTPPPIQRGASSIFRVLHVNADADPEGDANAIDWPKVPGRDEVADPSEFVVDVTTNADPAGDGDDGGNHVVKSNTYNGATADQPATEPLLRTLYLLEPRTTLERDGDSFRVVAPGQSVLPIPAARLHQIFCFGEVNLTSGAIALSLEQSVPIILLGGRGRYYGVLDAIRNDNLDITRAQHRLLDDNAARLDIARAIVRGKMGNALALMRRVGRHRPALADLLPGFSQATADACNAVGAAETASQLMGIEGAQAAAYFTLWRSLLPEE
ncbi:MAG TPA: CRISPR-associated endonuclease Cas1, partial [Kofleriaceae bacterium]|nr:CRISPR-associated endonuclease Cas1 [Kofleriaceae bacterium]